MRKIQFLQFYQKSTLVRQIASDAGPLNEMKYWRNQVVQLHSIMNQLRLSRNRAVIYLLNIAASPCSIVCFKYKRKSLFFPY